MSIFLIYVDWYEFIKMGVLVIESLFLDKIKNCLGSGLTNLECSKKKKKKLSSIYFVFGDIWPI